MTFPAIPRRSSALILALRSQLASQTVSAMIGYKLLMLQRSSTSKFMPNTYVFPGGVIEKTDFSNEWLELIGDEGHLPLKTSMSNSTFYTSYTGVPANSLPAYIAFRICAIRETFEESGALLVKPLGDRKGPWKSRQDVHINAKELSRWRKRVHNDSSLFIQFCRDIQCVPDIWSLYEWSNWVTPVNSRWRYNTIFYLAFLDVEPEICHDGQEMTNSLVRYVVAVVAIGLCYEWMQPDKVIPLQRKEYNIAPPHFIEILRLCWFPNILELKTFAKSLESIQELEAVVAMCKNKENMIHFLPGDAMYEKVKQDIYRHCQKFTATKSEDIKKIPLMQLSQTVEELQDHKTNHQITNLATGQSKSELNIKLMYNTPINIKLEEHHSKL